ncbi:MAG: hypothetical protein IMZ61_05505 [Planctomycetes bacterium]|nr:hypothetical protein [Planctomycetota bacterium]
MTLDEIERLEKMFTEAAEALAGRRVEVFLRPPASRGFGGEAFLCPVKGSRMVWIDLDPHQAPEAMFTTALHEMAHAKLHFPAENSGSFPDATPGSIVMTKAEAAAYVVNPTEAEADRQAQVWRAQIDLAAAPHLTDVTNPWLVLEIKLIVSKFYKGE